MQPSRKVWEIAEPVPDSIRSQLSPFSSIFQQILYNRGITDAATARRFLAALPPDGFDTLSILGVETDAERIIRAVDRGESIVVYGA